MLHLFLLHLSAPLIAESLTHILYLMIISDPHTWACSTWECPALTFSNSMEFSIELLRHLLHGVVILSCWYAKTYCLSICIYFCNDTALLDTEFCVKPRQHDSHSDRLWLWVDTIHNLLFVWQMQPHPFHLGFHSHRHRDGLWGSLSDAKEEYLDRYYKDRQLLHCIFIWYDSNEN